MSRAASNARSPRRGVLLAIVSAAIATGACAAGPGVGPSAGGASERDWRDLATARPEPVAGAARLSLTGVELAASPSWSFTTPLEPSLGLSELVVAGLLRRADVRFVERRRFAAAAAAEREGTPRPPGAPPVGVSEGSELAASVVWLPLGGAQATLEVRLTDTATGAVVSTRRTLVPADADAVGLARQTVAAILAALSELGRLPAWSDPIAASAPATFIVSGVPESAVQSFLDGLAAEEAWRWENARLAYQAAARSVGFFEASAALARTARLRLGGTLGAS